MSIVPKHVHCASTGGVIDLLQDAESPSDASSKTRYASRKQEVLEVAPTVFADADEQFASLTAVKAQLEAWKYKYPKEYGTAYVGESAAALFAPYVRLQLLSWDPLHGSTPGKWAVDDLTPSASWCMCVCICMCSI